jgi:O-antigen/teichoic acid export membrane protein
MKTDESPSGKHRLIDVTANLVGRSAAVLVNILLVQVYIRYIGAEAYGLISFSAAVQALFSLFDLGFSTVMLRESAKLGGRRPTSTEPLAELLRTFEVTFAVGCAVLIGLSLFVLPTYASGWFSIRQLSEQEFRSAFVLMACSVALRFPILPYVAFLSGLQRQLSVNILLSGGVLLRGGGALLLFSCGITKIDWFFSWQLLSTAIELLAFALWSWGSLGLNFWRARPKFFILLSTWPFARGVFAIAATAAVFYQADKIILTRLVPLEDYARYAAAATLAAGIYNLVFPIASAANPRLFRLVHSKEEQAAAEECLFFSQFGALLAIPVGLVCIFFSHEVCLLYLQNDVLATQTAPILRRMMLGALAFTFVPLPHALGLAAGKSNIILISNIAGLILLVPALAFVSSVYGLSGAAITWAVINIIYTVMLVLLLACELPFWHIRRWSIEVVILPLCAGLASVAGAYIILKIVHVGGTGAIAVALIIAFCTVLLACRRVLATLCGVLGKANWSF